MSGVDQDLSELLANVRVQDGIRGLLAGGNDDQLLTDLKAVRLWVDEVLQRLGEIVLTG